MADGNSLINFGDLSKPATVLIEKVSSAVGIIFEPTQIKRKARAESEAEKIKAVARIELKEIEHRALERFVHQETRKQENIESIAAEAAAALPNDAKVENLDEDWVAHFFKQCDTVSDKEMQSLWSRLLSGEATNPGTFSKRTVDFISSIDKKDAALFTAFCQFVWIIEAEPHSLIYEFKNEIYSKQGINFEALHHLSAIGLISLNFSLGYSQTDLKKNENLTYYETTTLIEFDNKSDNRISVGNVLLTKTGQELFAVCGAVKNQEFYTYVIKKLFDQGLVLSSKYPLQ